MWHSHSFWGWEGGWPAFGVAHLLVWVLLVAVAVACIRVLARRPPADRALEILRERFARGEIEPGEYEQRLRRLRSDGEETGAATRAQAPGAPGESHHA